MGFEKKLSLINSSTEKTLLIIEPWAEEYWISPNVSVDIIGTGGDEKGFFEVEYLDKTIVIYGWESSVVSVFLNGVELLPDDCST